MVLAGIGVIMVALNLGFQLVEGSLLPSEQRRGCYGVMTLVAILLSAVLLGLQGDHRAAAWLLLLVYCGGIAIGQLIGWLINRRRYARRIAAANARMDAPVTPHI